MTTCARCSRDLEGDSSFCRFCGAGVGRADSARRLTRIPDQGKIGGVCAGIAAYFEADVTLVRLAWVFLSIVPGVLVGGLIAYAAAWLLMPEAAPNERHPLRRQLTRSGTNKKVAGVCGGLAEYFGIDSTLVRVVVAVLTIYPGAIVAGVIAYAIAWLLIPAPSDTLHTLPTPA